MESQVVAGVRFGKIRDAGISEQIDAPAPHIFEEYFVARLGKTAPRVALLATASGDSDAEVVAFYRRMSQLNCRASDFSILRYRYPDLETSLRQQDILYIGNGSAPNLLAIWRANGVDAFVKDLAFSGVALYAEEEGAATLFEAYDSRALGSWNVFHDGLGILRGTLVRHLSKERFGEQELPTPIYEVKPSVAIEFRGSLGPYIVSHSDSGNAWLSEGSDQKFPLTALPRE